MQLPYDLVCDRQSRELWERNIELCADFEKKTAEAAARPPIPYEEGAIVPVGPWTVLSPQMILDQQHPERHFIGLVNLRPAVEPLWNLKCITRANIAQAAHISAFRHWFDEIFKEYIFKRWGPIEGLQYNGGYSSEPNLDTTTVSLRTKRRIGIHIDTWEGFGWTDRTRAKYRLSVNVGFEDRYFVFSTRTTQEFPIENSKSELFRGREIRGGTRDFQQKLMPGDMSFLRVRVPPGHAYFAPTEFVFHDGSTLGISQHTAMFSVRGFFQHSPVRWFSETWLSQ